ncbi:NUDIX domain-containing protein, partial [Microtetraspora sp. NBRC 13810]|uniref:NUDIX hydrolase n=1 Tax=Microtetraspora sp. NBRC 13810 TaxID=3030990 RepID=UPI0033329299
MRRDQPGSVHYTLPGGNVRPGEPLADALCRELAEELLLDVGDAGAGAGGRPARSDGRSAKSTRPCLENAGVVPLRSWSVHR